MKALDELIRIKLPRLAAHLAALEADVSVVGTNWYLTLFASSMPSETVRGVVGVGRSGGRRVVWGRLTLAPPALLRGGWQRRRRWRHTLQPALGCAC
jgi:hypothetical protein